ncbi:MAG: hypothetical protein DHS20C15_03190 [Planctomycetota bacterium]|nr:MAG: hypothetical protein DHS20C15_03190 [Planctomycetota bacterium]
MFDKLLAPQTGRAYMALRIVSGLLFAYHGAQKVFGVFGGTTQEVGTQMWVGGVIELAGGLMIALGIGTRLAAFLASGTMAVAYFQFHWKFQFDANFFPAANGGELAVLYCFLFLYIACHGNGRGSN